MALRPFRSLSLMVCQLSFRSRSGRRGSVNFAYNGGISALQHLRSGQRWACMTGMRLPAIAHFVPAYAASPTSQGLSMTNARQSLAAQLNAGVAAWHAEEVDKARLARCLALVLAAELPHVTNLQLMTNR